MSLTAREWLLLPKEEQEKRKDELSVHECFLLRTELEYVNFSEEKKCSMTEKEKNSFIHPPVYSKEKLEERYRKQIQYFKKWLRGRAEMLMSNGKSQL